MFVLTMYSSMIRHRAIQGFRRRFAIDRCNSRFIALANGCMLGYLIFEPNLVAYAGDAFIVVNIFYNTYLVAATIRLYAWWKTKTIHEYNQALMDVDHIVT